MSVTEKFGFKVHVLKYRKHLMRFFCCRVYVKPLCLIISGGRRGRDRMEVGFTTTCSTSVYHH